MKSYTDLPQSKKLAKFLPIESADMLWGYYYNGKNHCIPNIRPFRDGRNEIPKGYTPAWSLAALLWVLPIMGEGKDIANPFIAKTPTGEYYVVYATLYKEIDSSDIYSNPVDACVAMIELLHDQKLL